MSLNRAIIMGRITQPLEIRQTPSGKAVLQFMVAVDRYSKGEEKQADFISCVAWEQKAEFIGKYFGKGRMICVEGRLSTRTYDDKNGTRHYVTELMVDNANFTGEPRETYENASYGGLGTGQGSYTTHTQKTPENTQGFDESGFEDVLSDDGVPF